MKKIIVTVGPSIFDGSVLKNIESENHIYRINGSHGSISDIQEYVHKIRAVIPDADILIDLPGNKVRTTKIDEPINVSSGETFDLPLDQIGCPEFDKYVEKGDVILADDSTLVFVIQEVSSEKLVLLSKSDGFLKNNKGMHVKGLSSKLPFLLKKDKEIINLINEEMISFVGLSFVRNVDDVREAKALLNEKTNVIAKVETCAAIENLNDILAEVEYILIDRGDLSTDVGLERVPFYQKFIIEKALFWNRKVFLATQFLKYMQEKPIPSIAEVIDMYNTLKMGIYGIQLSEETAIGKYPKECIGVIQKMLDEIKAEANADFANIAE